MCLFANIETFLSFRYFSGMVIFTPTLFSAQTFCSLQPLKCNNNEEGDEWGCNCTPLDRTSGLGSLESGEGGRETEGERESQMQKNEQFQAAELPWLQGSG